MMTATSNDIIRPYLFLKSPIMKRDNGKVYNDPEKIEQCFYALFEGLSHYKYEPKIEICDQFEYDGLLIYVSNMSMKRGELEELLNVSRFYLNDRMDAICEIDIQGDYIHRCDYHNKVFENHIKVDGDEEHFTLSDPDYNGFIKVEV